MKTTCAPKSDKIIIRVQSNADALAKVRKTPVRAGQAFRDKVNDYKRKPKFFSGW